MANVPSLAAENPAGQVPKLPTQDALHRDQPSVVPVGVVLQLAVHREVPPHDVDAKHVHDLEGVDHVSDRLGHLFLSDGPVRMRNDSLRQRQVQGHQKGRPIYAVKPSGLAIAGREVLSTNLMMSFPTT
jgi:hypothetical protein